MHEVLECRAVLASNRDARWVIEDGIANAFVPHPTPVAPDWAALAELGARSHAARAYIDPPHAMLRARTHRRAPGARRAQTRPRDSFDPLGRHTPGLVALVPPGFPSVVYSAPASKTVSPPSTGRSTRIVAKVC